MHRRTSLVATSLLALLFGVAGCGGSAEQASPQLSPDAAAGKKIADAGCMGCHTTSGHTSQGPTWQALAGSTVQLEDGRSVVANDEYLTRSIQDPDAEVVSGFSSGVMSAAYPKGSLTDDEARQLVAYINSL